MSSLDCDIPFGDFFAEKSFWRHFFVLLRKIRQKSGHIDTPPSTISGYSLDHSISKVIT